MAVLLTVLLGASSWLTKRFKLSTKWDNRLTGVAIVLAAFTCFCVLFYIPGYFNDGKIKNIYITEIEDETRVVVWFTRIDSPAGVSTSYSHRIKSFNLRTGETTGRLTLAQDSPINDYHIFGPFNNNAWGYSQQTGISYLDLFDAKIISDDAGIVKRNPVLGDKIELRPGTESKCFDSVTFGIYVYAANGDIYLIDPDLKAIAKSDIRDQKTHDTKTCAVCIHEALLIDISKSNVGWAFDEDSKQILSFKNKQGKELNRINLIEMFDEESRLYAAVHINNENLLFITRAGRTLTAIKSDPETGKILEQIEYF